MISKNNNKISDNKSYKNITNNSKLNKYFSIENQAKNYQDVSQRNLKKYNTSNFKETNIFPANKLKGEQRTLENKNKSSPKTNKKINNLNEDKDEVKIVDVPLNFDYSYHSTNISNQDNNNNFNNEITQKNNNNNKDIYIKNIADIKSDIENIIKRNNIRNRSNNHNKIDRKNPNITHAISYDNKKRNNDLKGKTDNRFYSKYYSLKNNQFEDKIIEKKDKKDFLFNVCQNFNTKKNNKLTYEIDNKKGCLGEFLCNKNIIDNCQSNRRLSDSLIKVSNNCCKLFDGNECIYELNSLKKKNQGLEEEKNKYKNQNEITQNQLNFLNDKFNNISQKNVELIRQNEELKIK